MQTWTFPDHPCHDGPWVDEPDKAQWIDEDTDLDCMVRRGPMGQWCGYVGVPPSHPWWGRNYSDEAIDVEVHGDLTFSSLGQDGADGAGSGICHVLLPGRPDPVWWLGFDCGHGWDVMPRFLDPDYPGDPRLAYARLVESMHATYKTFDFVCSETRQLARQIKAAA